MSRFTIVAIDLVAIAILAVGVYFPRYGRRDLVLSYVSINIGVLAVAMALDSAEVGVGIGFGLFGVLSMVRLRSEELAQQEIAYYFSSLALGLLGGFAIEPPLLAAALMAGIVGAVVVADHPAISPRSRHQLMNLDQAFTSERELTTHLEDLLNASVRTLHVKRVDLVNDTTLVDVRFRQNPTTHEPGREVAVER